MVQQKGTNVFTINDLRLPGVTKPMKLDITCGPVKAALPDSPDTPGGLLSPGTEFEYEISVPFPDVGQETIEVSLIDPDDGNLIAKAVFETKHLHNSTDILTEGEFAGWGKQVRGHELMFANGAVIECDLVWLPMSVAAAEAEKAARDAAAAPVAASPSSSSDAPPAVAVAVPVAASRSSTVVSHKPSSRSLSHGPSHGPSNGPSRSMSSYGSYSESVMSDGAREAKFGECDDYITHAADEAAAARKAIAVGAAAMALAGADVDEPTAALMDRANGDLDHLLAMQDKAVKALANNRHVKHEQDVESVHDFCLGMAVQARSKRIGIEQAVHKSLALICENEAKKAKKAAHTCRSLAAHFEEKCEKGKCKQTDLLVADNAVIVNKCIDHAKDTKLAVKKARKADTLYNAEPSLGEAVQHRKSAEAKIDELELSMAKYGDAMMIFHKKKEKKARLKEEAHLRSCLEYESNLTKQRHATYQHDQARPRTTYHEVNYHALRTACGNHDYKAEDHHGESSTVYEKRKHHKTIQTAVLKDHGKL